MGSEELISPNVRREARESLVGWTLREIADLFHDHGFHADETYSPPTSGERRTYVEQFYRPIDWADRAHIEAFLPVLEAVIDRAEDREATDLQAAASGWSKRFVQLLRRDGYERDDVGKLRPRWVALTATVVDSLPPESAIPMLLRRMWSNVADDPDAAIGAAKEAIEATAKHVLLRAGESVGSAEKMPALVSRAHDTLGVHAKSVDETKAASDSIKVILGSLSKVALGVNDLRRDYGTGHGRPNRSAGLKPRHARLAAQSADAWVSFMLETSASRAANE